MAVLPTVGSVRGPREPPEGGERTVPSDLHAQPEEFPEETKAPSPDTVTDTVPAQPMHVELPSDPATDAPRQPAFATLGHLIEAEIWPFAKATPVLSG